jgi:hypothetical protein
MRGDAAYWVLAVGLFDSGKMPIEGGGQKAY